MSAMAGRGVEVVSDQIVDLAAMVPGPELAAALAGVEVQKLSAHEAVLVAQAIQRQQAHGEAQLMAVLAELAGRAEYQRCSYPDDADVAHEHRAVQAAGDEISLALSWTPARATRQVVIAVELVHELPDTFAALSEGRIDSDKARLIAERTRCLAAVHLRRGVEARVLPVAYRKTRGMLDSALRREVIAADPQAAEQRRRESARARRVGRPEPASPGSEDGMAQSLLYGNAEDLAAFWVALDAAARHARAGGDQRTLDQLRFDLLTGLGWTALELGHLGCCNPDCTNPAAPERAAPEPATADHAAAAPAAGEWRLGKRRGKTATVGVVVPFTTLAGLDDQPGWLDGYGPITAHAARRLSADATLRCLLTDPADGLLLEYGRSTYPAGHTYQVQPELIGPILTQRQQPPHYAATSTRATDRTEPPPF